MKHHIIDQDTEKWLALRQGKFTASSFKNLFLAKTTAGYNNEIYRVVYERLTGESPESFSNEYMDRGHELEPFARKEYELQSFNDVQAGGFFEHSEYVGCSPDGLVGEEGILEIKSPAYSTMIQYLLTKSLPAQYKWQVYGQLYITQRSWLDFFAYHPKLNPVIVRVFPNQEIFAELDLQLKIAIEQVEKIIKQLR